MNRRLMALLAGTIIALRCGALSAPSDSTSVWDPGVFFSLGGDDGAIANNGNALSVWLGAGYDVSSRLSASLSFSTGHYHLASTALRPVAGTLLLGAGFLDVRYDLTPPTQLTPFVGGTAGIATILDDQSMGYNGWLAGVTAGLSWSIGRPLTVEGTACWRLWVWQNAVGKSVLPLAAFHASTFTVGVSLVFHPVFPARPLQFRE
jgi:hypothetical protein